MAFGGLIGKETQVDLSQYVTETELNSKGFATQSWVTEQINNIVPSAAIQDLGNNMYKGTIFVNQYKQYTLTFPITIQTIICYWRATYYNYNRVYGYGVTGSAIVYPSYSNEGVVLVDGGTLKGDDVFPLSCSASGNQLIINYSSGGANLNNVLAEFIVS